jgi:hypothetical protein
LGITHGQNININSRKTGFITFHQQNENYQVNHCCEGCILRNGGAAWGWHDSLYTAMNIYQSVLQTNTKTGNLFKKGF